MNKKQQMIKKLAKRAKARKNKIEPDNPSLKPKDRYISKAERAKMELEAQQANDNTSIDTEASITEK
ncbi:DUF2986 domain-containing protein [Shewanella aestuarii]|uniref:DUF2986 domain-containing protein n=1 Tax=Shewanella aestuarii TaxID=1028752 RepID=A0A6G9QJ17_9GAMM|nr:DUF2986 domain-containing protein [Shewanella aestuarii]QIR14388.1 DUF2986 domain-containing protein [Shewanella aestuarii]